MWNLKRNDTDKLTNRNRLTDLENNLMVAGRDSQEFGKVMYTLLYSKSITNKDLLYRTWNSIQMLCANLDGRQVWGKSGYMYMYG